VTRKRGFISSFLNASKRGVFSEAELEAFEAPYRDPDRSFVAARYYRTFQLHDLPLLLRRHWTKYRLSVPTLMLYGTGDFAITPRSLRGYEPYADDMRVESVPDTGHFVVDAEPDLVARRAIETGWCVYAAKAYLHARGCPAQADELRQHDLVLYADNLHSAPPTRWLEPYRSATHTAARMDSLETACQAAVFGAGIVVLPAFVGDAVAELQRVFAAPVAANTGWVVYHESVREHPRIRAVADAMVAFFEAQASMFAGNPPA
jgi:hypothetical protein